MSKHTPTPLIIVDRYFLASTGKTYLVLESDVVDEATRAVNTYEAYKRIIDALKRWTDHGNMPKYDSLMADSDQTFGQEIEELAGEK